MRSYETAAADLEEFLRRNRRGRKRNVPITLPKLDEVEVEDRPRLARVRIAAQADPAGILSGEAALRPRYGVGEATPERMRHARAGGAWLQTESERTKQGADTGLQRKRFKSQLEVWFERGTIDRPTWLAAQAYQRDHDLSISAGGAMIAKYGPQMPPSIRELLPAEIRMEYQKSKARAQKSVPQHLWSVLNWIADSSNDEVPADHCAARYYPFLAERTRVERFKGLVDDVCAHLSRHYELTERHRWLEMATARIVAEIA